MSRKVRLVNPKISKGITLAVARAEVAAEQALIDARPALSLGPVDPALRALVAKALKY